MTRRNRTRNLLLATTLSAALLGMAALPAQAEGPRPITGYKNVDEAIYVLGITCGRGSLTAARVIDSFLLAVAPDLGKEQAPQTTKFGNMVQQLKKEQELQTQGYKGPVRRFLDRHCIIGYLTGSGSCGS